ncbi:MAG: gamma carbonic anhydrase family protein [Syntrophobacter sp.]
MSTLPYREIWPKIGDSAFIAPGAWIIGDVVIGDRSSIWFNCVVRGDVNFIRIGADTCVQDNSTLHVTEPKYPLRIGDRVVIGHRALVHGCVLEDECMIGMGAIILDGAKVGKGSIVAAGALLPPGFEVPPETLVMGSPAKTVRKTGDAERELIHHSWAHYAELASEYLGGGRESEGKVRGFLR